MENKKKTLLIIILIVLLIGLFAIYKISSIPKNIFLKGIKNLGSNIENSYNELLDNNILELAKKNSLETTTTIKPTVKFENAGLTEEELNSYNEINQYNMTIKAGYDKEKKELYYNLGAFKDVEALFDLNLYAKDKALYLEAKKIFDKYIKIPVEEYDELFETEKLDDAIYLKDIVKAGLLAGFDSEDFTKTTEEIKFDGKTIKSNKINYELNEKKLYKILNSILNKIFNDKKAINILATNSETDEKELKEEIKTLKDSIKENYESSLETKILDISIYSKGLTNEIVKYEILFESDGEKTSINYYDVNNKTAIIVENNNEEIIKIETTHKDKKTSETIIKIEEYEMIINKTEGKKFKYEIKGIEDLKIYGELNINEKEVTKNKEYKNEITFNINLEGSQKELIQVGFNIDTNTKIGEKLNINIPSDAVEYTNLTEEQMNTISENVLSIPFVSELINNNSMSNTINSAQNGAYESTTLAYIDAVEKQIMIDSVSGYDVPEDDFYFIEDDGNVDLDDRIMTVNIKGEKPTGGNVTIEQGTITDASLYYDNFTAYYEDGEITIY